MRVAQTVLSPSKDTYIRSETGMNKPPLWPVLAWVLCYLAYNTRLWYVYQKDPVLCIKLRCFFEKSTREKDPVFLRIPTATGDGCERAREWMRDYPRMVRDNAGRRCASVLRPRQTRWDAGQTLLALMRLSRGCRHLGFPLFGLLC